MAQRNLPACPIHGLLCTGFEGGYRPSDQFCPECGWAAPAPAPTAAANLDTEYTHDVDAWRVTPRGGGQ